MAKMNVTEKDFEAFFQAVETIRSMDGGSLMEKKSKVVGWCDTPSGLMKVCECQVCFSKFRYHGLHGSLETFLDSLEEDVTLKRKKHEI